VALLVSQYIVDIYAVAPYATITTIIPASSVPPSALDSNDRSCTLALDLRVSPAPLLQTY
jgi:hypothetical protein